MSDSNVILSDKNGNILHPETEWGLILNRPPVDISDERIDCAASKNIVVEAQQTGGESKSLRVGGKNMQMSAGQVEISSLLEEIIAADPNTNNVLTSLSNYPRSTSVLKKIFFNDFAFGIVRETISFSSTVVEYPSIRVKTVVTEKNPQGLPILVTKYQIYYVNGDGNIVKMGSSNMEFIPAIE